MNARDENPPTVSAGPRWLPGRPILRLLTLMAMDAALLAGCFYFNLVLWVSLREGGISNEYARQFACVVGPLVAARLALLHAFGVYRTSGRRTGVYELVRIALAVTIASGLLLIFNLVGRIIPSLGGYPLNASGNHLLRVPYPVVFNDWMLAIILTGGVRLLRREAELGYLRFRQEAWKRVLIVGAGTAGEQVARDLMTGTHGAFRPVAFIDPDPAMHGLKVRGLPVAGGLEDLPRAIAEHRPDEIAIALEKPSPRLVRRVVEQCRSARLEFRIVPPLSHLLTGRIEIDMLRPIEIEDLLGREPVQLETASESAPLAGKRVLVTGAGGSIGLELCRQTIAQRPAKLILLGRGENSLFEALVELKPQADKAGVELATVIGDIRDAPLIDATFDAHRPQIVFHAAAHKHVHFMQAQPAEAIKNNARGTLNVARAAARVGVERFILVSTDKAVRPVGVMGASKRVAEAIVAMIGEEAEGAFLSVRFGNVLGSRGSVIPTFRRQIAQGGPVTVTHPDVTRYFMTTAEAVSLTIEAGVRGRGGEIFLLDMGNPIRIADLARTLITLSGLEPEVDIPIVFTGLRPGEKLTEDLLTREEGVTATEHGKIFIARAEPIARERLAPALERLFAAADRGDGEEIERGLRELVPEYRAGETAEAGGGEKRAETGA